MVTEKSCSFCGTEFKPKRVDSRFCSQLCSNRYKNKNPNNYMPVVQDLPNEVWKPITGYSDKYMVSNKGRVKSVSRITNHSNGIKSNYSSVLLAYDKSARYYRVTLSYNNSKQRISVHRLVAQEFIENPYNKPYVNHKNGDKLNNEVSNLEWCTHKENMEHASKNLMTTYGEKNWGAKLTEQQVLEIRRIRQETNLKKREIGAMFGVSPACVRELCNGKTWKHLK